MNHQLFDYLFNSWTYLEVSVVTFVWEIIVWLTIAACTYYMCSLKRLWWDAILLILGICDRVYFQVVAISVTFKYLRLLYHSDKQILVDVSAIYVIVYFYSTLVLSFLGKWSRTWNGWTSLRFAGEMITNLKRVNEFKVCWGNDHELETGERV